MVRKNVVEPVVLPAGVRVGDRPDNVELKLRSSKKWMPYLETLKTLPRTKTLQIDLSSADDPKKALFSIKHGIKSLAARTNFKEPIRFALFGQILHIFTK